MLLNPYFSDVNPLTVYISGTVMFRSEFLLIVTPQAPLTLFLMPEHTPSETDQVM